jgi:hypothetical protein
MVHMLQYHDHSVVDSVIDISEIIVVLITFF